MESKILVILLIASLAVFANGCGLNHPSERLVLKPAVLPTPHLWYNHINPSSLNSPEHMRFRRQADRGSVSINAIRDRFGTNLNAETQYNLWRSSNGKTSFDANANYQQNFGGRYGTGRPNYGGGLTFTHRF